MATVRITVVDIKLADDAHVNEQLQWLGASLGLFSLRDKDKSAFRLLIMLIRHAPKGLSSDELASRLHLTRSTVIHHLTHLLDSRLVREENQRYFLAEADIEETIRHIHDDVNQRLQAMRNVAKEIDRKLDI